MGDDDRQARLGLNGVVEPGDKDLAALLLRFTPAEVWAMVLRGRGPDPWVQRARGFRAGSVEALAARHKVRFVVPDDPEWPGTLAVLATCEPVGDMTGAPTGLWLRGTGDLARLGVRSVALVGSRTATAYGERVSADWAADLAARDITVVSGAAYGIDAAAHRGALAVDGPTVAVLANGLDGVYPRANEGLVARVAESGVVVSEYPPGEHPTRMRFLARNRLIAALAAVTVVVEANHRSGARNTASWAKACGRQVGAVPGPVTSAQSVTPHRLVRDQEATLVATVGQVCEMLGPLGQAYDEPVAQPRLLDALAPAERAVYEALPARGARTAGELAVRAGLQIPVALAALGSLQVAGMVLQRADGCFRLGPVENRPLPSPQQDDEGREG